MRIKEGMDVTLNQGELEMTTHFERYAPYTLIPVPTQVMMAVAVGSMV